MTEPAAPRGTTSTMPPPSANGSGPPAPPRRGRRHTRISGMRTELIAGLPGPAWTRQPDPPPGHARPFANRRGEES